MLAPRFGATALPDIMADDTMEISSEHGQNVGDEDIDIDFDFTAGHVDEDYILEDAASNVGFGDDFHPQPSPAVGHDDLMIDEDDESYSMPVDGADFMRDDETHTMEDEALTMSFAPTNIPDEIVEEVHTGDTAHSADGSLRDEVSWEGNDEPEPASNAPGANLEDPEEEHQEGHQEDGNIQETTEIKEVNAPTSSSPHEGSRPNTPHNISPKVDTVGEEPRSPPASISAADVDSRDHVSEPSNAAQNTSSASQELAGAIENPTVEEPISIPLSHEVVVVYQDSEYSLFSKSEADDIDSYFLSDLSIKDKPLSDFFGAIREVIHEDLNEEDELCMSAEDLGLEIEEMSSMTGGVTIGQIINLHEKLLQNDGVESVRPLRLQLGTRPNFSTRLANLISGAAEAKGLSELVQWDEQSESFEDSAHVTDNEHEEEVEGESYEADAGLEDAVQEESEIQQQESSDDTLAQDPTAEQDQIQEADDTRSADPSGNATTNGTSTKESEEHPTPTEHVPPSQKDEASGSDEYDEDGDIIDYSEEDEAQPELRKDAKSHQTELETDENRTHNAEYEAINEDLRRRSISHTAEENPLEQDAEPTIFDEGGNHDHETNFETENDIEYNENDVEDFEQGNLVAEHLDQPADFGEDHAADFNNHEDEFYIEDGGLNGGEVFEGHDPFSEPINEAGQDNFDEFDFGEDDDTTQPQNELAVPLLKEVFSIGSNLRSAEGPDSESAPSERTLEAQPVSIGGHTIESNVESEDEIGYEDDEEPDVRAVQDTNVKEPQALNSGSAKRQRTDDDGTSSENKEAKRPRS